LVLDMLASVADGCEWFERRVNRAPVVYLALEGEAGLSQRVQAFRLQHGEHACKGMHFMTVPFSLLAAGDVLELAEIIAAAGAAGGVVCIDTLNRAAPGADENSSQDMGRIIEAAKRLQLALGGLVLLVHHTGKNAQAGLRGHSSLFAALDAAIEVSREGDSRAWKVAKSKDGQDGNEQPFRLEVVELGEDGDGESVTSCVIAPEEAPEHKTRCKLPKGGNQRIVLGALGELLRDSKHFGKAGAPAIRPCVELEQAVIAIAPRLTCEEKRRIERARQAFTGLVAGGCVVLRDGWLWLP
jgi:putative DNA primase/helicase